VNARRLACIAAIAAAWPAAASWAEGLKAGAAVVEITPPLGVGMYGFANRMEGATGVRDPLTARCLVLEAGEKRLAVVVLDLGKPPAQEWILALRREAARTSGISYVLVAATHTHSGPRMRDEYPPVQDPDWETPLLEKVARTLAEAQRRSVEARLGVGYGSVLIGHNRLRLEPDGTISWFERNNTMVPTSPVDPTVTVLRVDDTQGRPIAVLLNYACHPVVFGSDNLQYSADYPGVMARAVERELGGQPLVMFLQGGDGDINPFYAVHPLDQDAVKMREWTGERLGSEAARVAKAVRTVAEPVASLDFVEDTLALDWRWNADKFREAARQSWGPATAAGMEKRLAEGLRAPVATVLINRRIALMTVPGEPFVEHQIDWRNRCPVKDALFLGYANGGLGYFPTLRAAALGGYGAANSATYVQPDAGARLVDHALVRVYQMLGRLRDTPEDFAR